MNLYNVYFTSKGTGPRSGQFEDRCLWKQSRRYRDSSFRDAFRDLFCAVSSEDQELKDRRTDEHYGIERTAAFDLGWGGNSVKGDSYASTDWARSGRGAQFPDAGKWR